MNHCLTCSTVLIALLISLPAVGAPRRPNVVLIYTDDQGSVDVNCYGAKDLITPHMDALAAGGVRFTQFYSAAPVCSPSRAALLTGRYPQRAGLPSNAGSQPGSEGMPSEQITLAEILRSAGYVTGHVGKWHLGYVPATMPNGQGFDFSFGHMGGCIDNYSHFFYWSGPNRHDLWRDGKEVWSDGNFFPDLMVREARDFIARRGEQPFFLYWPINTPHYPLQGTDAWRAKYAHLPAPRRDYAAFVSTTDERIGRLMQCLDDAGLREDTIVIFQSDHGHSTEERTFGGGGSAGPYRGAKFSLFEGGIRVPAIIRWTGALPENQVRQQMATSVDWLPTILQLCGVTAPSHTVDGRSLVPLLHEPTAPTPHSQFHWQSGRGLGGGPQWAVREGSWKLLGNPKDTSNKGPLIKSDRRFLVNLADDIGEARNVADQHPEIVKRLEAAHVAWLADVNSPPARKTVPNVPLRDGQFAKPVTPNPQTEYPLELSTAALRELVELSLGHLETFLTSLPEQPAWNCDDAERAARSVMEPLPEQGASAESVLRRFFDDVVPIAFNTTSPGYLAYVPGGGLPQAALADLIAGITNRFVTVWSAVPAVAQIEATVIRWFCEMVGYPAGSGGFLTSGGSLANLSAIVTARRNRAGQDFQRATIYTSDQTHHSICKAAVLAGFPIQHVRQIAVDEHWRVRVDLLGQQVARDRAAGFQPLIVVAQAGSTNTGAVDDLNALADLTAAENLWLHADAAYGGFFMLTQRGQRALAGLGRADSLTLDPHKGLFLPYGTGCLLVRDRVELKTAHDMDGAYMPAMSDDPDFVDFSQISPELSRDFRGLRVWLPLQLHGAEPFRRALDEKLDLAEFAARELRSIDDAIDDTLEIVAQPQLSIVAFRLRRQGLDQAATNALNQRLLAEINAPRRIYLTPTQLNGDFVIRICVLSFRTHLDRMQECVELIRRAVQAVIA